MKYLKQFLIILVISLVGELMNKFIPLPVPASIYGMVILFAGLLTGLIKLDAVKEAGRFLIEIMPVMFIPAGVGLISSWLNLKPILVPICIITVATIFTVMGVSGHVTQFIVRRTKRGDNNEKIKHFKNVCNKHCCYIVALCFLFSYKCCKRTYKLY